MSNPYHDQRFRKYCRGFAGIVRRACGVALIALFCPAGLSLARTLMDSSPDHRDASVSAVFERQFDASTLGPQEKVVLLVCASDGAVVRVNGHEVGRINMPQGPIDEKTLAAPTEPAPKEPGPGEPAAKDPPFYHRLRIPAEFVLPGRNIIDAEVHSGSLEGSTLDCDLELKTLPTLQTQPEPDDAAKKVLEEFRKTSYIPAGTPIPDGYIDGGHGMRLDSDDHATSSREILVVDRPLDPELQKDLEYARGLRGLDPIERARKLALYVALLSTPPGGLPTLMDTVNQLQDEFKNRPLCIGDVIDQCHAGVCRHRSLLFKLLADEAGLKTALVRGNYFHAGKGDPHAWNEILLDDGRRFLVDSTLHPKDNFPEITNDTTTPVKVANHYVKLDDTPYYHSSKG